MNTAAVKCLDIDRATENSFCRMYLYVFVHGCIHCRSYVNTFII